MSRRFRSPTMKFGVPLSVLSSRYIEQCYGKHGKAYGGCPSRGGELELVLISEQRRLCRVPGFFPEPHKYVAHEVGLGGDGWKILGWRMADGSMPLGAYDAVDPDPGDFNAEFGWYAMQLAHERARDFDVDAGSMHRYERMMADDNERWLRRLTNVIVRSAVSRRNPGDACGAPGGPKMA